MNYTTDQLHAIKTDDRNLQIIACAGSGKTQVISERIVNTLRTRANEGVVVNGRIDLIRHTDTGEFVVVDFKSDERAQEENITQRQLHVYAVGFEQLTGTRADLIEIHNLDRGGAIREVVDQALTTETIEIITQAGRNLRTNMLPRLTDWCDTCSDCDLASVCRCNE